MQKNLIRKIARQKGFTIVEVVVIIIVIGILGAVTAITLTGYNNREKVDTVKIEEEEAIKKIEDFYAKNGFYPTSNNCPAANDDEICLEELSSNTTIAYVNNSGNPTNPYDLCVTWGSITGSKCLSNTTPASLRASARGSLAAHQTGDILFAFACNSSATIPTFSADWTVLASRSSGYSGAIAYKMATSPSMAVGTINSTYYSTASVSGGSRTTTTGSSPSFSAGTATGINSGNVMNIPTIGSIATAQLQLAYACGIGYGGNPWLYANYSSGLTKLQSNNWHDVLVSSQGTSAQTITENYGYGIAAGVMVTVKLTP